MAATCYVRISNSVKVEGMSAVRKTYSSDLVVLFNASNWLDLRAYQKIMPKSFLHSYPYNSIIR